jgi:DeoR family glycerol-3-phosphate regulon repressor
MCDRHLMTRTHGGAIISSGVENLSYPAPRFANQSEKAATKLIPDSCSLFINIGTTTEEFARCLDGGCCSSPTTSASRPCFICSLAST